MQVGPYTFPPLHINLDSLSNTWFLQVVTFKSSGWVGVQSYLHNSADPQNTLPLHYSASPPSYFEHNFRQHIISPLNTIAASPKNDSKITAKLLSSYININYLHTVLKYMCSVQIFPTAKKNERIYMVLVHCLIHLLSVYIIPFLFVLVYCLVLFLFANHCRRCQIAYFIEFPPAKFSRILSLWFYLTYPSALYSHYIGRLGQAIGRTGFDLRWGSSNTS